MAFDIHALYKPYVKLVEPKIAERDDYAEAAENELSPVQKAKWGPLRDADNTLVDALVGGNFGKKVSVDPAYRNALAAAFNRGDSAVEDSIARNRVNWDKGAPQEAPPQPVQFSIPVKVGSPEHLAKQAADQAIQQAKQKEAAELEVASRKGRKGVVSLDLSRYGQAVSAKVAAAYVASLSVALEVAKAFKWEREQDKTLLSLLTSNTVWRDVPVDDLAVQTMAQVLGTTSDKVKDVFKSQGKLWDAVEAGKKGAKPPTVPSPATAKLATYPKSKSTGKSTKTKLPPPPVVEGADDSAGASVFMEILPWVVGGIAVAGLGWFLYKHFSGKKNAPALAGGYGPPAGALANPARGEAYTPARVRQLTRRAGLSHDLAGPGVRHNPSRCLTCG